jgi:putative hydrolase of the HAD superfamily
MAIAAILFDLDGTLHSREAAFSAWLREEAGTRALDIERIAALDARGRGAKATLLEYLAHSLAWPETSLDERLGRFREGISRNATIDPRTHLMLSRLRSVFRLGIVSNGTSATQRAKLRVLRLEPYFDPILISEEVGVRKPQPEIFWMAAKYWSIPSEHILVVGDDESADIHGARNAGMQALLVSGEGANAPQSIRDITELESWLSTLAPEPA